MKSLFALLIFSSALSAYSQETVQSAINKFDAESTALLTDSIRTSNPALLDAPLVINEQTRELQIGLSDQPKTPAERELLVLLGAGLGAVHNMSVHGLVIRKQADGRLSWFVEGELAYLQTKLGYAPNDIVLGAGIFPFKKPTLSTALKLHNPTYSEKIGVGPELGLNKFAGKNKPLHFFLRVSPVFYIGEKNSKGQNFSMITEAKIGMSVRIMKVKR